MLPNPERLRRFIKSNSIVDENGCWIWRGNISEKGYARIWVDETIRYKRAARVSYEVFVGEIPEGFEIDHLCRNRACVNPDPEHLEPVTHHQNVLRAVPFRLGETCRNGHTYSDVGYRVILRKGRTGVNRVCKACLKASSARYRERKAG
jgi:hypothetical protein